MPAPIVPRVVALNTDRVTASLPKGYRARPFEERDREPWIVERNTWYGPMEQGSAEEWRIWESMSPDDSLLRLTVEDGSGHIAAIANVSNGGAFRHPDGAQNGGVSSRPARCVPRRRPAPGGR